MNNVLAFNEHLFFHKAFDFKTLSIIHFKIIH